jgi:hypothetical protein
MNNFGEKLYRSHDVLWRTIINDFGIEFIADTPLCPNSTCHMLLQNKAEGYYCAKCDKLYKRKKFHVETIREVRDSWEGFNTLAHPVYSLDLPPTKVVDEAEDENYWVQARISEKEGKRMAVVYFGQRIRGKQDKGDYSQVFLDFDDEQLRFDKTNKNPMKQLAKLSAEFNDSETIIKHK